MENKQEHPIEVYRDGPYKRPSLLGRDKNRYVGMQGDEVVFTAIGLGERRRVGQYRFDIDRLAKILVSGTQNKVFSGLKFEYTGKNKKVGSFVYGLKEREIIVTTGEPYNPFTFFPHEHYSLRQLNETEKSSLPEKIEDAISPRISQNG